MLADRMRDEHAEYRLMVMAEARERLRHLSDAQAQDISAELLHVVMFDLRKASQPTKPTATRPITAQAAPESPKPEIDGKTGSELRSAPVTSAPPAGAVAELPENPPAIIPDSPESN